MGGMAWHMFEEWCHRGVEGQRGVRIACRGVAERRWRSSIGWADAPLDAAGEGSGGAEAAHDRLQATPELAAQTLLRRTYAANSDDNITALVLSWKLAE